MSHNVGYLPAKHSSDVLFLTYILLSINNFKMFEELLLAMQNRCLKGRQNEETGKVIEVLKRIRHFHKINNLLGTDYLLACLSLLSTFVLRKGQEIIDESDHFVLVEGELREEDDQYHYSKQIQPGTLIEKQEKGHLVKIIARSDCKMIRIKQKHSQMTRLQRKLAEKERERNHKMREFLKIMKAHKEAHKEMKRTKYIVTSIDFFSCLGEWDLYDFILKVSFKEYILGNFTHENKQQVKRVGYLVEGKTKLLYVEDNPNIEIHDKIIKRYKINMQKDNKGAILAYQHEGDWIGLDEYLWNTPFKSSGEVISMNALVLWIPTDVFYEKFNARSNYQAISKLFSLVQAKKTLFERSYQTRRQKEVQSLQEKYDKQFQHNKISEELKEKIQTFQIKEDTSKCLKIKRNVRLSNAYVPEFIKHRVDYDNERFASLPKVKEKINLFPKQYQECFVNPALKKQLNRLEQDQRQKSHEPKDRSMAKQYLNPEIIYKNLFDQISFRFTSAEPFLGKNYEQNHSKQKLKQVQRGAHYNHSICNNFKIVEKERLKANLNMHNFQTLSIIPELFHL